jgi:hypothetical protein
MGRVVPKAMSGHEVEVAVAIEVLTREQQALLGADQLDRGAEDELPHVLRFDERAARLVSGMQLRAQLLVPLAFGPAGALEQLEKLPAAGELGLSEFQLRAQAVNVSPQALGALLGRQAVGGGLLCRSALAPRQRPSDESGAHGSAQPNQRTRAHQRSLASGRRTLGEEIRTLTTRAPSGSPHVRGGS